jgi:two-component system sensor histidine kinase KdpD
LSVKGVSYRLRQVLGNLADNAIKYTPQGTPVELSAYVKESELVVEIEDRGPGIPQGEEERIFDKFVRGSAAGGGIGLGLTICRAKNAHGGKIRQRTGRAGAHICFTAHR